MDEKFTISIIMTAYNASNTIEDALSSIKISFIEGIDIEIIVIDDGSLDDTNDIVNKWILDNANIKVRLFSQINKGPLAARVLGIGMAAHEYIYFVDADDLIDKDFLKNLLQAYKILKSDVYLVSIQEINSFGHKTLGQKSVNDVIYGQCSIEKYIKKLVIFGEYGYSAAKVFKKNIFKLEKLNQMQSLYNNFSEDMLISISCLDNIKNIFGVPNCVYYYLRSGKSISSNMNLNKIYSYCNVAYWRIGTIKHFLPYEINLLYNKMLLQILTITQLLIKNVKIHFIEKYKGIKFVKYFIKNFLCISKENIKSLNFCKKIVYYLIKIF